MYYGALPDNRKVRVFRVVYVLEAKTNRISAYQTGHEPPSQWNHHARRDHKLPLAKTFAKNGNAFDAASNTTAMTQIGLKTTVFLSHPAISIEKRLF